MHNDIAIWHVHLYGCENQSFQCTKVVTVLPYVSYGLAFKIIHHIRMQNLMENPIEFYMHKSILLRTKHLKDIFLQFAWRHRYILDFCGPGILYSGNFNSVLIFKNILSFSKLISFQFF